MELAFNKHIYFYLKITINDELDLYNSQTYLPYLSYVSLGGLLPFHSELFQNKLIPIRWIVNGAETGIIKNTKKLLTSFIRPEDLLVYEKANMCDVIEFEVSDYAQE